MMKKYRVIFLGLMLGFFALAQEPDVVTVTGDRVSLRAAPELNAVLLDRAMSGDQLLLADNSNPEWVGVRPPQEIDLWVHSGYLHEGVVLPPLLNIRSGPSLSHGVVAIVSRDKKLTVRGELDGWMRIAPPEEAVVWISRKYTDLSLSLVPGTADEKAPVLITGTEAPAPENESKIVITVIPTEPALAKLAAPDPVETEQVVKTVLQPVINDVMIAAAGLADLPETLTPDSEKEQGVAEQFTGTLQPANAILYKLIDPKLDTAVVCYIRGNAEQMAAYAGRLLTLTGKVYWAKGLSQPFLVPEKIEVLKK